MFVSKTFLTLAIKTSLTLDNLSLAVEGGAGGIPEGDRRLVPQRQGRRLRPVPTRRNRQRHRTTWQRVDLADIHVPEPHYDLARQPFQSDVPLRQGLAHKPPSPSSLKQPAELSLRTSAPGP